MTTLRCHRSFKPLQNYVRLMDELSPGGFFLMTVSGKLGWIEDDLSSADQLYSCTLYIYIYIYIGRSVGHQWLVGGGVVHLERPFIYI